MLNKEFLRAAQKGDLTKCLELKNNINDWSIIRHGPSGDSPLHIAAREGHLEIVRFLCENWKEQKCTTQVVNLEMKTPLHEAAQFSRTTVVDYFIEKGANVNALKRADWTPLMLATTKTGVDAYHCVRALLNANANLSIKNKDGWTAFHVACRSADIDIVNLLLKYSSKCIEARSNNGRNALHIAAFHGCENIIELLVSRDGDLLNARDSSGSTSLHESIKCKNLNVMKLLIKLGADINAIDDVRQNILHIAAAVGNIDIVQYILECNMIDVQSEALFHITPLVAAQRNAQYDIVELLLKYSSDNKREDA